MTSPGMLETKYFSLDFFSRITNAILHLNYINTPSHTLVDNKEITMQIFRFIFVLKIKYNYASLSQK